jgi:peptidoglycan/xylan/chitin deacetylase (PgdA/CDA1 family)
MGRVVAILLHDVYLRTPGESGFPGGAADRYKVPLRELDVVLASLGGRWSDPPVLAPGFGGGSRDACAITVDDGGESYYTLIADRLDARGWRGHCFMCTGMIGRRGFLSAGQLRDLDARGHVIGSHSATHPTRFSACSRARMLEEWRRSRGDLEDLLGPEVRTASLPGGYFSQAVAIAAGEAGLHVLFTSEPVTRPKVVGDCLVVGRLSVRPGRRAGAIDALARGSAGAIWREWIAWNAKKLIKPVLGPVYPRLGAWIAMPRQQGERR